MSINTLSANPIILNELGNIISSSALTGAKILSSYTAQQPNQSFASFSLAPIQTLNTTIGKNLLIQISGSAGNTGAYSSAIGLYINNTLYKKLDLELGASNTPFTMSWQYPITTTTTKIDIQLYSSCNTKTNDYVCLNIFEY